MTRFDDWLEKHERVDTVYTWVYCRTVLRARQWRHLRRQARDLKPYRPGGFYLDHGWTPAVVTDIDAYGAIRGVSMVDGTAVVSDIYACGPMPVSEKDAWKIANLLRKWEGVR